jgi:GNAT superfamily N-acetyltransferase
MSGTVVRPVTAADEAGWRRLWAGYNAFYRASVPEAVTAETFRRLLDPAVRVHGLVAATGEGALIGLVNYLYHPSTWSAVDACYLEDLFVDPAARGSGTARALIEAVMAQATADGCFRIYWHTQEYNAPARSLYDTLVPRSSFIVYRKPLG